MNGLIDKFKVKDVKFLSKAKGQTSEIWYYGMLTLYKEYTCHIKDNWYNEMICDASTLCRCTGLRDKNGELIWEGDIILFQRDSDDCPFPNKDTKKRVGKVFYSDFRATFAIGMGKNGSKSLNDDLWKYVQNGNRVEVIGNIFDNPELLKAQP